MKTTQSKVDELREALKAKKEAEAKLHKPAREGQSPPEPPRSTEGVQPKDQVKSEGGEIAESAQEAEDLSVNLRAAEEEAKQHYDKLLRVMAEFENFKKRVAREHGEKTRYANERLILEILPVLDDLDRVLDHVPEDSSQEVGTLADGVLLVRKTFYNALQKFGLQEIVTEAEKFDPNLHEALTCIDSAEHDDGTIIAVNRKGYKLEDRVIRAAQVTVAKKVGGFS